MPTQIPDDVRQWLDRQDEPERAALAQTWSLAALAAPDAPATDADAAWARLDRRLDAEARRAPDRPAAPSSRAARWRLAASAVALAAVAVATALWWTRPVVLQAEGAVLSAALPDGSAVALAPGSELSYRRGLDGSVRAVRLEGEAFFDVEADGRPFRVETFNARVEVLGTEFAVRAWAGAPTPETAVALVEGAVRVRREGGGLGVVLAPGQATRVEAGEPVPPRPVDVGAVAAWRAGGFSAVDAPLGAVAAALEARFGRPVRLGVDPGRRLTLYLPAADSAEVVLRDLAAYLDLRLQVGPDGYDLLPR